MDWFLMLESRSWLTGNVVGLYKYCISQVANWNANIKLATDVSAAQSTQGNSVTWLQTDWRLGEKICVFVFHSEAFPQSGLLHCMILYLTVNTEVYIY